MISGSTDGIHLDINSNVDRKSIVDLLEAKDISWKAYMEGYPGMLSMFLLKCFRSGLQSSCTLCTKAIASKAKRMAPIIASIIPSCPLLTSPIRLAVTTLSMPISLTRTLPTIKCPSLSITPLM